jgi:hypothetical protein
MGPPLGPLCEVAAADVRLLVRSEKTLRTPASRQSSIQKYPMRPDEGTRFIEGVFLALARCAWESPAALWFGLIGICPGGLPLFPVSAIVLPLFK